MAATTLQPGERVVVELRRPGLADAIERNLDVATPLAAALEARIS